MRGRFIKFGLIMAVMMASLLVFVMPASAAASSFSGTFDGSELEADMPECGELTPYDVLGPVQVSVSGTYNYGDLSIGYAVDMMIDVYQTSFDPANTGTNHIDGADDSGSFTLTSGINYFIVVMPYDCDPDLGTWEFVLTGPGTVSGGAVTPSVTLSGTFDGSEPQASLPGCGGTYYYDVFGPVQVTVTGTYNYVDISIGYAVDMYLIVYENSFDVNNPNTNVVDDHDDSGPFSLSAGVDYYFVIQPLCGNDTGTWEFSISGPGAFTGAGLPALPTLAGVSIATDARLNPNLGDIDVVIYPGRDNSGDGTMQIYCVNQLTTEGFIAMVITPDDLPSNPVSENTLLMTSEICEGRVEFYALAAGGQYAFQVNVGPSVEGTVHEYLFNSLSGADLIMRTFNLYELGD